MSYKEKPDVMVEPTAISVDHINDEQGERWEFTYTDGHVEVLLSPCDAQHRMAHMPNMI